MKYVLYLYILLASFAYANEEYPCGLLLDVHVENGEFDFYIIDVAIAKSLNINSYKQLLENLCPHNYNYDTKYFYGDFKENEKVYVFLIYLGHNNFIDYARISDAIEIQLAKNRTIRRQVTLRAYDKESDFDGDTVSLLDELELYSTNPYKADTDDDNLRDDVDIFGTNITICIDNQPEHEINTVATDPLVPDSDNDGVLDGDETYGLAPYGFVTDPTNPDTDSDGVIDGNDANPLGITDDNGDGIPDEWVIYWTNNVMKWGFDPSMADMISDPDGDADGDGVSNREEYDKGTAPIVSNGHYELRFIPSTLSITSTPDNEIVVSFDVVSLSWCPTTNTLKQLSQHWCGYISSPYVPNSDYSDDDYSIRYYTRFGIPVPFTFTISTDDLNENTIYYDEIYSSTCNETSACPVFLCVSPGDNPNHAPTAVQHISPDNGAVIEDVYSTYLNWHPASDQDNDSIVYDIYFNLKSAYNRTPMTTDVHDTSVHAYGWSEFITDRLNYSRQYQWYIGARDEHGAVTHSPVWYFSTLPSNYTHVVILSSSLSAGNIGKDYSDYLEAAYGFPPYSWKYLSGTLPDGLTLVENGLISGTPLENGTFPFQVEVSDSIC